MRFVFGALVAVVTVTAASFVALPASPAFAAEYVPQLKDMKQILVLGQGLDRLIAKLKDPDQIETVREVRSVHSEERETGRLSTKFSY